jgi:hypothetical protein
MANRGYAREWSPCSVTPAFIAYTVKLVRCFSTFKLLFHLFHPARYAFAWVRRRYMALKTYLNTAPSTTTSSNSCPTWRSRLRPTRSLSTGTRWSLLHKHIISANFLIRNLFPSSQKSRSKNQTNKLTVAIVSSSLFIAPTIRNEQGNVHPTRLDALAEAAVTDEAQNTAEALTSYVSLLIMMLITFPVLSNLIITSILPLSFLI